MKHLSKAFDLHPQWVQPKTGRRGYELRAGDDLFATLVFESAFGSLATGSVIDGSWTFKRVGFFRPRVTVRNAGEEKDTAVYHPRWTGTEGVISLTKGPEYTWKVANFWATEYLILDAENRPLVTYKQGVPDQKLGDILKTQARVEFPALTRDNPHLPLLALLGWYLMILQQEDSAAVATVVAAT